MRRERKYRVWIRLPLEAHRVLKRVQALRSRIRFTELDPPPPSGFIETLFELDYDAYRRLCYAQVLRLDEGSDRASLSDIIADLILTNVDETVLGVRRRRQIRRQIRRGRE